MVEELTIENTNQLDYEIESIDMDIFDKLSDITDFSNQEIPDNRINSLIDECVTVKIINGNPMDIDINFAKMFNIENKMLVDQLELVKTVGIKRRKVNGTKFFKFLKDFKILLSAMNQQELQAVLALRILMKTCHTLSKKERMDKITTSIMDLVPFTNRFIRTRRQSARSARS